MQKRSLFPGLKLAERVSSAPGVRPRGGRLETPLGKCTLRKMRRVACVVFGCLASKQHGRGESLDGVGSVPYGSPAGPDSLSQSPSGVSGSA